MHVSDASLTGVDREQVKASIDGLSILVLGVHPWLNCETCQVNSVAFWFDFSEATAPAFIAPRLTNELQPRVPLTMLKLPLNKNAVVPS